MPTRIVTHAYRPKLANRRKRAKTAAITGPVRNGCPKLNHKRGRSKYNVIGNYSSRL